MLEPLGTQVQLYCRVDMTHRTAWSITLPSVSSQIATSTETLTAVDFLAANHGIVTNVSSPENREPPLRINGTIENSETSVQCIAIDLMNPTARCQSAMVSAVFYGEITFLATTHGWGGVGWGGRLHAELVC